MDKYEALYKYFGYSEFKEGQETAIDTLLGGGDVLCVMPTGGGKSLCYQLPAVMLEGIALVVSPLISLMKDQVDQLAASGIKAAFINSTLTPRQQSLAIERMIQGAYRIVYIAPERLDIPYFVETAKQLDISLVAVDEAHCVSQWGQDFRPSYLKIAGFLEALGEAGKRPAVCALTATATERVRRDITEMIGLRSPAKVVTSFDRPNLRFEVRQPLKRDIELRRLLGELNGLSGIIYCATRKNVDNISSALKSAGFSALPYHAGMSTEERTRNQNEFIYDRCDIIVATNAFGMGINKSNVSFVIHYNMPKDLESYYQEAGRAGRDGRPARCVLLYNKQDIELNRFFIYHTDGDADNIDQEMIAKKRLADEARLHKMIDYCETQTCLRAYILNYFGEGAPESCHNCSRCADIDNGIVTVERRDVTTEAQQIISCVIRIKRMGKSFGKTMIADVLHGETSDRITYFGLNKLSTYGIMKGSSKNDIKDIIDLLVRRGLLAVEEIDANAPRPVQVITGGAGAMDFLRSGEKLYYTSARRTGKKAEETAFNISALPEPLSGLYEQLRTLRTTIAVEAGVPPYIVMSNATLYEMCRYLPQTEWEMMRVPGIGENKYKLYGERFLAVTARALRQDGDRLREARKQLAVPDTASQSPKKYSKSGKMAFYLDKNQRGRVKISDTPVGVNDIARAMNELIDKQTMTCVTGKNINEWLLSSGYLSIVERGGVPQKRPTQKGIELGITEEEHIMQDSGVRFMCNVFSPDAQRFVVENYE